MIKKIFIAILIALLSFARFAFVQADSGRMYELDNVVENGDISVDTNADGLGNNFYSFNLSSYSASNNRQYFNVSNKSNQFLYYYKGDFETLSAHKYYLSFSNYKVGEVYLLFGKGVIVSDPNDGFYSTIFTSTAYREDNILRFYADSININAYVSNVMMFDLTLIFGLGNEPSLSDFEMYYLPDLDYFEYYNSFDPTSYVQLLTTDYTNITTDLTGIDYSKSIIARNGDNMNIDFYAYFYDSPDATGSGLALHYYNYNRPEMRYLGTDYTLLWEYSDYSDRVLKLSLTDEQNDVLKTILFNRVVDPDNEYFEFRIDAYYWDYVKIYVVMTSTFDLLVDVKSFMISRETETLNDFNINNEMNVKTYDQKGNLYLPIIKLNLAGDQLETRVIDGFGSGYTRISRFNFEFEFTSPENDDPYAYELQYLYELGIFSSDDVLIPPDVDIPVDLDGLFPYQVCDAFQIGCHLKNSLNDVVLWLWDVLDVQAIYATFSGIVQSVNDVIDLLPSWVNDIMLVLAGALTVGFVIIIFDRSSKGGES